MVVLVLVVGFVILFFLPERLRDRTRWLRGGCRDGALDNFVKLPLFKPDTPALGAIINFETLSLGHNQCYVADRTIHTVPP
jgi:hypothetical protein